MLLPLGTLLPLSCLFQEASLHLEVAPEERNERQMDTSRRQMIGKAQSKRSTVWISSSALQPTHLQMSFPCSLNLVMRWTCCKRHLCTEAEGWVLLHGDNEAVNNSFQIFKYSPQELASQRSPLRFSAKQIRTKNISFICLAVSAGKADSVPAFPFSYKISVCIIFLSIILK